MKRSPTTSAGPPGTRGPDPTPSLDQSASPLVSAPELAARLGAPGLAVVDCRFSLAEPEAGGAGYRAGHIPGAVYAHLERDLSGPHVPGVTGRHPLPEPDALAATLGRLGIGNTTFVVAYDESGGALAAARLWWLLGWLGHDAAAVLDGGLAAWRAAGLPLASGIETRPPARFAPRLRPGWVADAAETARAAADPDGRVLDARGADRFRGENETIDPVAGRIPGAVSAPFAQNLDAAGRFRSSAALRERYEALLDGRPADEAIAYCGSGVTAAHDVLAMRHAGLPTPRLYAGSWSEWITDPARPVASDDG
jgi:thiosulfate/3-mercaptopyruvate sulfurtransferase